MTVSASAPPKAADPAVPVAAPKVARAIRVPNGSLKLDVRPDEAIWESVPPLSDFVQKEPVYGIAPSEAMEVRFAYDDEALWLGRGWK